MQWSLLYFPHPQSAGIKGGSTDGASLIGGHAQVRCKMCNVIGNGKKACASSTNAR